MKNIPGGDGFKLGVARSIGVNNLRLNRASRKRPHSPFLACGVATWLFSFLVLSATAAEITRITVDKDRITIAGKADNGMTGIAELAPYQTTNDVTQAPVVAETKERGRFKLRIPRWDGARDRLYSAFVAFTTAGGSRTPAGNLHFVEETRAVAKYREAFPKVASKKGLQVQMVDDAIALGVKHAALNLNLSQMISLKPGPDDLAWQMDGDTYHFQRSYFEGIDRQVKPLSDAGMVVTFILLCYKSGDEAVNRIMLHPHYSPKAPHRLSAFNTSTPDGLRYFKACIEFLTERYSEPGHPHGRAVNFIVGNEVNAHWEWANLGDASMETFADDYLRTVRVCNTAVHKFSAAGRVYISLEHHWNIRYDGPLHSFRGRDFVDYFNRRARAEGNFDWQLAFHPYPEDLREPRTWNDKTATRADNTPRITFKNLDLLPEYFKRPELLYDGKPRHIILSEQGFNTPDNPNGELWQAAGYCYAYYKIAHLPGIDSFILHRQVDHRDEDGLKLGLWHRNEASASPSEPGTKKMIYEVFRQADTPQWRQAFAFALPVIGIKRWEDLDVKPQRTFRAH